MPVPRPGLLLPQSSPPTALPLSGLVPPSPPLLPRPPPPAAALAAASYAPEPPGRRGWARGPPGFCLHAPRRPDVPCPRGAFAWVPASASARLPAAPAVTGEEAAGSAGGVGEAAGSRGSARRARAGEPRHPGFGSGWADSCPGWTCGHG